MTPKPRRPSLLLLPVLLLLAAGSTPAARSTPAVAGSGGGTISARGLVRLASGALGDARRLAGSHPPPTLRQALDDVDRSLGAVVTAFSRPGPTFFQALASNSRAASRLAVVWDRSGADPVGRPAVGRVTAAAELLRGAYGWEGVRHRQGGPLTAEEARRLHQLQEAERRLAVRLADVGRRARQAGDRASAEAADALAREARRSAEAAPSLDAYLAANLLADILPAKLEGNRPFVRSAVRKVWSAADAEVAAVEDLAVDDEEVGFVFAAGLGTAPPGGWGFLQKDATMPEGTDLDDPAADSAAGRELLEGEIAGALSEGDLAADGQGDLASDMIAGHAETADTADAGSESEEAEEAAGTSVGTPIGSESGETPGTQQVDTTTCGDDSDTCTGLEPADEKAEDPEVPADSTEPAKPTEPAKIHPAKPPAQRPHGVPGKTPKPATPPAKPPH